MLFLLVDRMYCCSCLVYVVFLRVFVVLCGHCLFLLQMPETWLEVSILKVLRPVTSTQIFSWFPCVYKQILRRFPRFVITTTCFSRTPPDLNLVVTNFMMPDCWLEVRIRKVLRPAISTQFFLGFPVPKSKC